MPKADPSTPRSLLERVRQPGDREAWARFVDLYTPLLLVWGRRLRIPDADHADFAQTVFQVLVRELPAFTYDPTRRFRGYLFTIARSRAADFHRRNANQGATAPFVPEELAIPDGVAEWVDQDYDSQVLRRALSLIAADFEPRTAEAFRRVVLDQEPAADVARSLDLSMAALYQLKARVIRRLRDEFQPLLD